MAESEKVYPWDDPDLPDLTSPFFVNLIIGAYLKLHPEKRPIWMAAAAGRREAASLHADLTRSSGWQGEIYRDTEAGMEWFDGSGNIVLTLDMRPLLELTPTES